MPDSIIYPILLMGLMPLLGYNGIWLAYAGNALLFIIALYLIRSITSRSFRLNMDRMLCLDQSIRDHVPALDISILSNNADATGISQQVHEFLQQQGAKEKTAYVTALCLEELAADFVAHTNLKGDKNAEHRIIIRNASDAYNPLDFDLDKEDFSKVGIKMVQKLARRIDYNYVYRMNIVTIDVDK